MQSETRSPENREAERHKRLPRTCATRERVSQDAKRVRSPESSHRRNHFQFYRNRRRQCTDLDRSTSWIWFAGPSKIFCVDSVVDWKIFFHVCEKDSDIDDVLPGCAGVFQHKPHVFKDSATLRFNVVTNNVAGGIERYAGNFLIATHARTDPGEK